MSEQELKSAETTDGLSLLVISLLKGVVYQEGDAALWNSLLNLQARVRVALDGLGADVAIVAIGVPSLANDAIRLVRHRGRVSLFAGFSKGEQAELDVNAIHYNRRFKSEMHNSQPVGGD